MKKLFFLLVGIVAIPQISFADIVVRGAVRSVENGQGNTYIKCRGLFGECVRITTATNGSVLAFINSSTPVTYKSDSYTEVPYQEGSEQGIIVTLVNSSPL